jgi:D-inositol-3-phosphate glycosyltransferase
MIVKPRSTIRSVALVSEHASPCAPLGGPDGGGQNVYMAGLATELGRRGIEVTVYTRRHDPGLPSRVDFAPGVAVEYIDAGPSTELTKDALLPHMGAFGAVLRSRWTINRPDIVHAHYWMSGLASLEGVAALGIPFIQTFHALGIVKRRFLQARDTSPPERISAELQLARVADAVVATSAAEAHELIRMKALADRIKVVPCGVNTDVFCPDGPSEQRMSRLKRIVMVGRLVRRKGVDEVVRALRMLPMIELVIVGGSGTSDPDADRLRALACREGVDGRVELRGPLANGDIPRVLRSADLVVCFPWYEPFGIITIEAMACGRPLLVSAVGGLRETVIAGRTGILVAARDSKALANAADMLLRAGARCAPMGEEARRRAVNVYDWRCVVDRMLEVYATASKNRTGRVPLASFGVGSR